MGLVWSLFLLGHLRLSRDQTLLSLFFFLQFENFLVPCHQGAAHWLKETDCKLDMFLDQVESHIITLNSFFAQQVSFICNSPFFNCNFVITYKFQRQGRF